MSDSGNLILFLITQLLLPFGLSWLYCRRKGIATDSWRAGSISLVALSAAALLFSGLLGLPAPVKNVGFVTNRPMGFAVGAIGILAGIVMSAVARRFEGRSNN